jgi:hypothetical protein
MDFLCFAGLRRLSGITRSVGGVPAANRARRRASFAAVNFVLRFLLAISTSPHVVILSEAARSFLPGNRAFTISVRDAKSKNLS